MLQPKMILLFGSRVKRENFKNADFDLAIDAQLPDIRTERETKEKIREITALYKVDITWLKNVSEEFREIIFKTGRIIYERRT